jgi:hypothetical protein
MNVTKPLVGVAALALASGVALPTMAGSGNKYAPTEVSRDCGDGDTVVLDGPAKLWPPNHKFVDEPVTATDSDSSSQVSISVYPTVTDAVGGDGGPQHDPDANASQEEPLTASGTGSATAGLQLRAERSGKGEGRTYTINWMATFDNGSKHCNSTDEGQTPFTVTTPHDMRGGADFVTKD